MRITKPSKLIILKSVIVALASPTLGFLCYKLGWAGEGMGVETINWFREHWIISTILGIGNGVGLFFAVLRIFFPVNWYLWRLKSYNPDVRRGAAKALGKLGATKEQMLDGYLKALASSESDVRRDAAEALGKIGDKRAVEPLINRLSHSSSDVRRGAAEALEKLGATKEQMLDSYLKALASSDSYVCRDAAEALGKIGDKRAVEPLEKLLLRTWESREAEVYGPYGESWGTNTEYNPEYRSIFAALTTLRKEKPVAKEAYASAPKTLNVELIKRALQTGKINPEEIKDTRLRDFLIFLKENGLADIVVLGGAVKGVFFSEEISDIDSA